MQYIQRFPKIIIQYIAIHILLHIIVFKAMAVIYSSTTVGGVFELAYYRAAGDGQAFPTRESVTRF